MTSKYVKRKKIIVSALSLLLMSGALVNGINASELILNEDGDWLGDVDIEIIVDDSNEMLDLLEKLAREDLLKYEENLKLEAEKLANETDFRASLPQNAHTPINEKNNFLDMRKGLEEATNSVARIENSRGLLYTIIMPDNFGGSYATNMDSLAFKDVMLNGLTGEWLKSDLNSNKLKELAAMTFSDVKSTDWFACHIPFAVYLGLVSGYEDGEFKGNNPVTRAELSVILKNVQYDPTNRSAYYNVLQGLDAHKNMWYYNSMDYLMNNITGLGALTVEDMNSGATRGEVAIAICKLLYNNEYMDRLGDMYLENSFNDIKEHSMYISRHHLYYGDDAKSRAEYFEAIKNVAVCPADVFVAVNLLKDLGIMVGDTDGNSNWNQTVTRGEILALFERSYIFYTEYDY